MSMHAKKHKSLYLKLFNEDHIITIVKYGRSAGKSV